MPLNSCEMAGTSRHSARTRSVLASAAGAAAWAYPAVAHASHAENRSAAANLLHAGFL
jgi:hypothetical protein